jgi:radical SAM superfamily enzyme YgiQ (UPF0313 family)
MRVLLIQPPSSNPLMDQVYLFEPLALEYLGAGLKLDGHAVEIIDARLEPDVEEACRRFQPDLVGLTGFTSHLNIIKDLATRLKKLFPELLVVVGGHHATVRPEDFNAPDIDVVVIGEGVFTLGEIIRAVEQGSGLREIKGLAIPCPDGMLYTAPRPYTDLNALPFPDRTLTARHRQNYFSEWFMPLASIRTSLGCTARCNFCALWGITGGRYLRRDPAAVLEELKTIAEPNIFFCDDESMCDVKRMETLADLIRDAGLKKNYFLYGRVDTIVNNPGLLAKWAKIGLSQVFVGMEDFSEARLVAMKKGVTSAQQVEAARILDDLGIMMYASFMVDPAYSREDFSALIAFVRRLKLKYATFTVMTPLPGTELHAAREQEILSRKPELYDMLHALLPTTLPLEEFYQQLADLYTKAVPLHRALPAIFRFGPRGLILRVRLLGRLLARIRGGYLDY